MSEEDQDRDLTQEEMLERIRAVELPSPTAVLSEDDYDYGEAAGLLARMMLQVAEEDTSLLDVPSREEDLSGIERATNDKLWQAVKERWQVSDLGFTGFQYGWAHGAVRYALGREPVGNPAIVDVEVEE